MLASCENDIDIEVYSIEGVAQRVHRYVGRGVDRALDAVAGKAAGRLFDSVADFGTLTCYGLLGSDDVTFNAAQFIFRDVHVRGYSRLRYLRGLSKEDAQTLYTDLFECQKKGLFHTPILKTFSFAEVCTAVEMAEHTGGQGKVLLIPSPKEA